MERLMNNICQLFFECENLDITNKNLYTYFVKISVQPGR